MFRKIVFALAATVAFGIATLSVGTSPAQAKGWKHHHHHHHSWRGWRGYRFFGPAFAGCYVKRVVLTPWGEKVRWVNRCY
jgi:hypothetical protein